MTLTPSLPDVMAWPGAWGFLGAVVYGAPKLLACVCSTAADHPRAGQCTAEAIVALIIGTIAATAFEPWIDHYLKLNTPQETRAMSTVIGVLANPTAPGIISFLSGSLLNRIKGGH